REDRRRKDLRLRPRAGHSHPHRRDRKRGPLMRVLLPRVAALAALLPAASAFAAPVPDNVSVEWITVATLLVVMMTIPGLALFYGGLVRAKNMLSVLMQVLVVFALIVVLWTVYGYSLAFGGDGAFYGDFSKAFL